MDGALEFACQKSSLEWSVEEHGSSVPTGGPLAAFTLEECGNDTVIVMKRGRFDLHATTDGNGTMTWTGAEITVVPHRTIFGFPVTGPHCIYATSGISIGIFTGSATTEATATLEINSPIPQIATDTGCGSNARLTGSYKFTNPDYLDVD